MNVRPMTWGGPALGLLALTLAAAWLAQAHQTGAGHELGWGPQAGRSADASALPQTQQPQAASNGRTRVLGSSLAPSRLNGLDPNPALLSPQALSALHPPAGLAGGSGDLYAQHAGEARSGNRAGALAAEPAGRPARPLEQMRTPREPLPPGAPARQAAQQAARQGSNQAALQLADAADGTTTGSTSTVAAATADTSQASGDTSGNSSSGSNAGTATGDSTPGLQHPTQRVQHTEARQAERLYWLHLAAQRGDAEAQYQFAHAVLNQPQPSPAALSQQGLSDLAQSQALQAQARRYLVAAMDQGVLEAYQDATRVAREGGLGLAADPVQALAIPLALRRGLDLPQTRELLDQAWREASPAQQLEAQRRSVSDLGRWMH